MPSIRDQAYAKFIASFWQGTSSSGYLSLHAFTPETPPSQGSLWTRGHAFHALYSYWVATGSADAKTRMGAYWTWIQANWTEVQATACGVGQANTAQDDTTWSAGLSYEVYLVTGDPTALRWMKEQLDCAWSRWWDLTTGGGLWYRDAQDEKSSYQAPYALLSYLYYKQTGDTTYQGRALLILNWANSVLWTTNPSFIGLYWCNVDTTGTGIGSQVNNISINGSWTFLAGNMAFAALEGLLYRDTGTTAYLTSLLTTSNAMATWETVSGTQILLDDRDPRTNAWSVFYYKQYALPYVPSGTYINATNFLATAVVTASLDANFDQTFGGDWQGPPIGVKAANGNVSEQLEVSSQVMSLIAAGF